MFQSQVYYNMYIAGKYTSMYYIGTVHSMSMECTHVDMMLCINVNGMCPHQKLPSPQKS